MAAPIDDAPGLVVVATVPADMAATFDGALPPEELHITLCYLGKDVPPDSQQAIVDLAAQTAGISPPLTGQVSGIGTLGADGALVCLVEANGLSGLQEVLSAALVDYLPPVDEQYDAFVPHSTLGYPPDLAAVDFPGLITAYQGREFPITELAVWSGGNALGAFPLVGQDSAVVAALPPPDVAGPSLVAPGSDVHLVSDPSWLPASYAGEFEILAVREGQSTGMRRFEADALTWRPVPQPLMFMDTVGGGGHEGARSAGAITEWERRGADIWARGFYADSPAGWAALITAINGEITGASVDLDEDGESELLPVANYVGMEELFTRARLSGLTITPHPALPSAGVVRVMANPLALADRDLASRLPVDGVVEVLGAQDKLALPDAVPADAVGNAGDVLIDPEELLLASASPPPDEWAVLAQRIADHLEAGGSTDPESVRLLFTDGHVRPPVLDVPADAFANPSLTGPTAPTYRDGRFYGHLALWGQCHRGLGVSVGSDGCVLAPRSASGYRHFMLTSLTLANNQRVRVGKLTVGTGHAPLWTGADRAAAHYDNTGLAAAFVAVGEDRHGIWFSGVPSPYATDEQLFALTTSQLSGDWRRIDGRLELVAALAVNVPGFAVPSEPLVASATNGKVHAMMTTTANHACTCGANVATPETTDTTTLTAATPFAQPAPQPPPNQPPAQGQGRDATVTVMASVVDDGTVVVTVGDASVSTADDLLAAVLSQLGLTTDGSGKLLDGQTATAQAVAVAASAAEQAKVAKVLDAFAAKAQVPDLAQWKAAKERKGRLVDTQAQVVKLRPALDEFARRVLRPV